MEKSSKENILDKACDIVVNKIEKNISSHKSFRWLKKDLSYDSHSDLCFMYKGSVFSIIIDICDNDGKTLLSEDKIKRQVKASDIYNMVPCRCTLLKSGSNISSIGDVFINTKTNEKVIFDNTKRGKSESVSELYILYHGLNYLQEYLLARKNKVVAVQYVAENDPHIIYTDKIGNKSYVIAEMKGLPGNINLSEVIDKYKNNNVYKACLSYNILNNDIYNDALEVAINDFLIVNSARIDVVTKCENIEQENAYDLIVRAIQQKNISDKEAIGVFPIPGYRDFLLKIHNVFTNNINLLSKDLAMIPYEFEDSIKNNPHFGIPLYHIDSKDSEYIKKGSIPPEEIVFVGAEYANISIIKKVSGESVKASYDEELSTLNGSANDHNAAYDMLKMIDIYYKYGIEASEYVLKKLERGGFDIEPYEIKGLSEKCSFVQNGEFSSLYNSFVKKYLDTLKQLSALPQKTYLNAVKNIILPKNFIFDFVIPNNTFIDYQKQEFNFIDFRYEKFKVNHTEVADQIPEFRNVLLGQYNRIMRQANQLLFRQEDINQYNYYSDLITQKIKNAASTFKIVL